MQSPTIIFDTHGNAYYSFQASPTGQNDYGVNIMKSTDKGATWLADVEVQSVTYAELPHMAIDLSATGAYKNYIYVAYTERSGFGFPDPVRFSRSVDLGQTFSSPQDISAGISDYECQGVNLAVGPNSELYAAFAVYDGPVSYTVETAIGFNKSTNGGTTWGTPVRIPISGFRGCRGTIPKGAPGNRFVIHSFPSIDGLTPRSRTVS